MDINKIPFTFIAQPNHRPRTEDPGAPPGGFRACLEGVEQKQAAPAASRSGPIFEADEPKAPPMQTAAAPSPRQAAGAYGRQASALGGQTALSDIEKYKDDQLLSNPGGDQYDLAAGRFTADPPEQKSFWGRVGKDIRDAFDNVKNFFGNLLFGAKRHYRGENGEILEVRQRGLVGSVVDFFRDLGSALSFGAWRPDGEEAPLTFKDRLAFTFSKIKEAVFGDLVQGVAGSIVNMGEDLLFAGWNLVETVPDATIGNFEAGRKATTAVFDNGQVILDYITDIIPGGEASVRVHSSDFSKGGLPILHNIRTPERNSEDERWKYVRNTPFRKALETVGSILMDIFSLGLLSRTSSSGEKRNNPD